MLQVLFGAVNDGRLARLPFLGYWVLIWVIAMVIAFGIGAASGMAENLAGGDIESAPARLQDQFGIPGLLLILLIYAALLFAGLNVEAKRLRDIGLPGWWTVLGIFAVGLVIALTISQSVASGFNFLIWAALLLVPGNAFGGASGVAHSVPGKPESPAGGPGPHYS